MQAGAGVCCLCGGGVLIRAAPRSPQQRAKDMELAAAD